MIDAAIILGTLESAADRHGDPTAPIYKRLFSAHPELEALFHMDRDGGVRASMVQQGFECILDHVGPRRVSTQIISAARVHHDGYGVPAARFDDFFVAIRDAIREIMGAHWSPAMDAQWTELLAEFRAAQ